MKRPLDKTFSNGPSGSVAYLFALEKYSDFLEKKIKNMKKRIAASALSPSTGKAD